MLYFSDIVKEIQVHDSIRYFGYGAVKSCVFLFYFIYFIFFIFYYYLFFIIAPLIHTTLVQSLGPVGYLEKKSCVYSCTNVIVLRTSQYKGKTDTIHITNIVNLLKEACKH